MVTSDFKTQADIQIRAVSLANLLAMCDRASGHCHRYHVSNVSRSRVHVEYSNPNEYGAEYPITAVFPCIPNGFEADNPYVLIGEVLRVIPDRDGDGEGHQYFYPITDGPQLWRTAPHATDWQTAEEIAAK